MSLINKIVTDERQVHSGRQANRTTDIQRTVTNLVGSQIQASGDLQTIPIPPPLPQTPSIPQPDASGPSTIHSDRAIRIAVDKAHSDLMRQHTAALAAQAATSAKQTAAMDRAIQDKDRLLREERTKRRADDESQKLMVQLQFQKDKQVQLQQHQQQKQLADQAAETIRITNQLHDVQAIHFQHIQVEKANNGNLRASVEQQQQLSLKEGIPPVEIWASQLYGV